MTLIEIYVHLITSCISGHTLYCSWILDDLKNRGLPFKAQVMSSENIHVKQKFEEQVPSYTMSLLENPHNHYTSLHSSVR